MNIARTRSKIESNSLGVLLCFLAILFSGSILADELRPTLLKLNQLEDHRWSVSFKQPQFNGRFLNLKVTTNCTAGEITPMIGRNALQENFELICDSSGLETVGVQGLEKTLVDTLVTVRDLEGRESNYLISASQLVLAVGESAPAVPVYIVLGIEHLVFGIDHVLFVLVLLYVVKGWRNLLMVITSFTVAHSVTLGLSSLELVSLAQAPVEALISLSIVFLAAEAFREDKGYMTRAPWVVSALFGLLHGLGFAGALADIGLPQDSAIAALLFFNIGIELGQIAVVGAALALVAVVNVIRNHWEKSKVVETALDILTKAPLLLAGVVAGFWCIERTIVIVA